MGKGGMRTVKDEKVLLTEYAKLFHIARANAREARNTDRSALLHPPEPKKSVSTKSKTDKEQHRRLKSSRRSQRGGTVWMVLKGGFANVPTAAEPKKIQRNKIFRGQLSERRRREALEAAEQYVETAWQEAHNAGLLLEDQSGPNGEEGLQYLREQYKVAAGMLRREPVGAHMKRIVEQACAPAHVTSSTGAETVHSTNMWAEIIARENAILKRFDLHGTDADANASDVAILQEAAEIGGKYYFDVAEPLATRDAMSGDSAAPQERGKEDIMPTKCIVRIRNSGKQKHTSILSTMKAVNYFKSNFMQTLRKELSGSKLLRGEETTPGSNQQHEANVVLSSKSSKKRH